MHLADPLLGVPKPALRKLESFGIDAPRQLVSLCDADPAGMSRLMGTDARALRGRIASALPPEEIRAAIMRSPVPPLTGALHPDIAPPRAAHAGLSAVTDQITARLDALPPLPERISLEPHMPPPFSQNEGPTCVGQAVAGLRSYLLRGRPVSGEHIYQVAKTLDSLPHVDGTFMRHGMEAAFGTGAVPSADYTYEHFLNDRPIGPLAARARAWRIRGHADLLAGLADRQRLPKLLHAILAGQLIDGIGPRPIPISTPVFPSMLTDYARDTGIFHMPLPHEASQGGHAWLVSGIIMGTHPDAPGGRSYLILRNSWSRGWARHSPIAPGHALMPLRFFEARAHVYEALLGLAEPAPIAPIAA